MYSTQLSDHVIIYSYSIKDKCYLCLYKVPIFLSVLRLIKASLKYVKNANE